MTQAQEHYERMLARHYTWMFGVTFDNKIAEQCALLREAGIGEPGTAVDLGCGSGFQTLALTQLGAVRVHAIDSCRALLDELKGRANGLPITHHESDLRRFDHCVAAPVDTIVCMGDTLTHLERRDDVSALIDTIASALTPGGRCILSWRDLSAPPKGLDRFIPLRHDPDRIMTCFLEDQGETVLVHDLVHVLGPEGWRFERSAYPKLKLAPDWVRSQMTKAGLPPYFERTVHGMIILAAMR